MKTILRPATLLALGSAVAALHAANPIIQTIYTADPAPVVHDGVLYVFTSHDEDELVNNFFTMRDWRCYSTTDMVNWTGHGAVASLRAFSWAGSGWGGGFDNGAWAPQAIERDGKWYLYVPLHGRGIGVLVADNPFGPYTDPIGKPLIGGDHIDPSVFIADDGQAYLYWGNPKCWYAKLNRDMISLDESIGERGLVSLAMTPEAFGPRAKPDEKRPTAYEEGPWLYQRGRRHYLFHAAGPLPEHLAYSVSESPTGPWRYSGVVMPAQGGSFTNHPGVVDYKGRTYLFYHNAALPGGGGFKRSVCVEELTFNSDSSVVPVTMSTTGPALAGAIAPYRRVEAETVAWAHGVETSPAGDRPGNMTLRDFADGAHVLVRQVDFGSHPAREFSITLSAHQAGATIELRLDRLDGPVVATVSVPDTQGQWQTVSTAAAGATGVRDLFFVFKGPSAGLALDWWTFVR
ncbi:MAG TPA: glycoside hydrolase family 43 protein [Opitutaceae bacterium]